MWKTTEPRRQQPKLSPLTYARLQPRRTIMGVSLVALSCLGGLLASLTLSGPAPHPSDCGFSGAWKTQGRYLKDLVSGLKRYNIIKSEAVEQAMLQVDRKNYCLAKDFAYHDSPQSIGLGQTISAPHMHGMALEQMKDYVTRPNARVLDVGSGSGCLTAYLAAMVGPGGKVIALERIKELKDFGQHNVEEANPELKNRVEFLVGDGFRGVPEQGPFDAIHVGAAAPEGVPPPLLAQLKNKGRMIIPIGGPDQTLMQYDKDENGAVKEKMLTAVRYVPLLPGTE